MATNITIDAHETSDTTHGASGAGLNLVGTSLKLASVFALLAPLAAHAEDGDIETMDEISVTASRTSTAIKESPVTIDIIDEEELDIVKFIDSEKELLQRIPGNSMSRNLRIPMGSKNYTVNLIDGMAVGKFGSGTNGFADETNGSDIQRIEVLKGPASVLYGSNAIGGVINVITKDAPLEPEYRIWGEGGQYNRGRGGTSAAGTAEGIGYFIDANVLNKTGWQDRTRQKKKSLSGKFTKDLSDNSMLTVRAEYLDAYKENPGSLSQAQFDEDWSQAAVTDAFTDEQMLSASAQYMLAPTDNSELNVSYSIRSHQEAGPPSYSATGDYGEDDVLNQNLTGTYRYDFDAYRSRIIAGADIQRSDSNDVSFDGRSAADPVNARWDISALVTSPFVQFETSPSDRLRLTLGARYDRVKYDADDTFGTSDAKATFSSITRKVGATWQLNNENNLWVGYGEGFVVPSRTYLFTTTRYIANPDLNPEKAKNYEVGIRGRLFNKRMKYDVALYNTTIKDLVVVKDEPFPATDTMVNVGEARFRGLETSAAYMATDYLKLAGSYTFARNQYIDYVDGASDYSGNDLSSSPKHHLNLRATVMPTDKLAVELEWDKISDYHTHSDNAADPDGKASRSGIYNLRLSYDMEGISFWAHARNLLDTKYTRRMSYSLPSKWSAGGRNHLSGEGRAMLAGVAYNW